MPPRIRKIRHDEDTRAKIKVSNLITRMQSFAMARARESLRDGELHITYEDEEGNPVWPMTKEQIAATRILLDKALPNLTSVDVKQDVTKTYVLRAPPPAADAVEWLNRYGPKTIEGSTEEESK